MEDVLFGLALLALIAVLAWVLAGRPVPWRRRRDADVTAPLSTAAQSTHQGQPTLPLEPAPAAPADDQDAAAAESTQAALQAEWHATLAAEDAAERAAEEAALRSAYEAAEADAARRAGERQAAERQIADAAAVAARRAEAQRLAAERRAAEEAERLAAEAAETAARAAALADAQRVQAERAAARAEAQRAAELAAREQAEAAAAAARIAKQERLAWEQRLDEERRRAEAQAAEAAAATPPRSPEQTLVMIADDSKVVRVKTSRLLAQQGYRVALAEDGADALRQFGAELPQLLITDVEMPGMDGFELTRQVRSQMGLAQLPIIMITSADDRLRDAAAEAGVTVLMGKPYSEEELLAQIARHTGVTQG